VKERIEYSKEKESREKQMNERKHKSGEKSKKKEK
jgi:hypothetical protein